MLKNKKTRIILMFLLFTIILGLGAYGLYLSRADKPKDMEISSTENSSLVEDSKTLIIHKEGVSVYIYDELLKTYNSYMNDKTYNTELPEKDLNNPDTANIYVENGRVYYGNDILVTEIADPVVSYEELGSEGDIISVFVTDKNELYYSSYMVGDETITFEKLVTTEKIKGVKKLLYSGIIDFVASEERFYVLTSENTVKELEYSWSGEDFKLKNPDNIMFDVDEVSIYKNGTLGIYDSTGDDYKLIKDSKYPNIKIDKMLYCFGEGESDIRFIIATDGYLYKPVWNYTNTNTNDYKMSLERVNETKIKEAEVSLKSEYNEYTGVTDYSLKKDLIIFFE